ncbi:unnamed protein product [Acanthoscelides obtectus]|uniref:Uncharacterized protein n=1 Tax=Acanthoscelides obtectus TaxID=200917 RepID=A0A9P0PS99_ACAOB|nr:unnamed protein product [Acanthoscelides obtectus]CAK1670875.1 hypothetical protein AOBTE_LOCUS27888 [Acanthoscelides obtectus]
MCWVKTIYVTFRFFLDTYHDSDDSRDQNYSPNGSDTESSDGGPGYMEFSPFQNQNEMQDFVPSPVLRKSIQEINYDDGPPSIHQNNFEYIPGNCINEAIISLLGEGEPHDFYNR